MRFAVRSLEDEDAQIGGEFRGLTLPVHHHAGRGDHERGLAPIPARLDLGEKMGQGLEGFPEAHVIGEDAMEAVREKKLHPLVAFALVVAQLGTKTRRHGDTLDRREVAQLFLEFDDLARDLDRERFIAEFPSEEGGVELAKPQRPLAVELELHQLTQGREDASEATHRQNEASPIGKKDEELLS